MLGISHEHLRWAWALAARTPCDPADTATTDVLALLDGYQPGQLAPMQRAECNLGRARRAVDDGGPDADEAFTAAIAGCASTPPPTTWPMACSTTPSTCSALAVTRPRPAKPAASHSGYAASRCSTARTSPSPLVPVPGPRDDGGTHRPVHKPTVTRPQADVE